MRYSVLLTSHAARDLRKLPRDVRVRFEIAHATGFSQWLMTDFLSAEFIRRQFGENSSYRSEILRSGSSPTIPKGMKPIAGLE